MDVTDGVASVGRSMTAIGAAVHDFMMTGPDVVTIVGYLVATIGRGSGTGASGPQRCWPPACC